jgi:hypothetical protein
VVRGLLAVTLRAARRNHVFSWSQLGKDLLRRLAQATLRTSATSSAAALNAHISAQVSLDAHPLTKLHWSVHQIDVVRVLEYASDGGQVPRGGMHAESSCKLEAVPLEVLRTKIARDAFLADGLCEGAHNLAAVLEPTCTDLAGVQLVLLPAEELLQTSLTVNPECDSVDTRGVRPA